MNSKLVESLVEVIGALTQEDYSLFQKQLTFKSIQKTVGICGEQARVRNTRIPVWTIISLQNQGAKDEEIMNNYPSLTPFDLMAVKAYYSQHDMEIDTILAKYAQEDEIYG